MASTGARGVRPLGLGLAAAVLAGTVAACSGTPAATDDRASGPATASAPKPAQSANPSRGQDGSFTVVASGDVLIHPPLTEQAARDAQAAGTRGGYDFGPIFAGVAPVIKAADLAICHLETPLGRREGPFSGYPVFSAPPQVATALAGAGYDTCSTASNHTLDKGGTGVRQTLDALDGARIRHTGSARSAAEAATVNLVRVAGVGVAQLSYTFGFNGFTVPRSQPWLANRIDAAAIRAAARKARAAGAAVVIVSLHWGTEFQPTPNAQQRSLARTLLASPDIDLIVGHHAHVTQPFERIGGEWVAYGLGTHVARHAQPRGRTEESVIARFTFTRTSGAGGIGRWSVTRAEYVPVLTDLGPPIRLVHLKAALANGSPAGASPAKRASYQAALDRISAVVTSRGAARAGLVAG